MHEIQRLIQHLIHMGRLIRDTGQTQHGLLPQIQVTDFGHRHVELVPKPVFHTLQDLTFVLQGVAARYEEFDRSLPNDHAR